MVLSDPQEKIQAFREAIRRCPHHARAHHELGLTLFLQLGKKRDALLSFDRAVQINPRYTKAYANRSAVRTHSGDYVGAISDLDRALELLHQRPAYRAILYRNRGMAYYHQGDLHAALDDYSKAIHHAPQRARAYVDRALIRHEAADVDGMLRDLNRAIAIDPQFRQVSDRKLWLRASGNETPLGHRAYLERGRLRMLRQDYRGALRDLDLALRFKQDSAVAHDIRGQARMGLGDPARAIADYTQALKLDPKSAATYNNRGLARQNQGDLTGAIADFTLALKHDPKLAELYYNRSVAHLAKSDHTAAIADLNQAITLDPKLALAYHNRGIALRAKGDLAGAIADYTQLIKLDPTSHDAHTNRGEARLVMGDISGALADFTPGDHAGSEILADLGQQGPGAVPGQQTQGRDSSATAGARASARRGQAPAGGPDRAVAVRSLSAWARDRHPPDT